MDWWFLRRAQLHGVSSAVGVTEARWEMKFVGTAADVNRRQSQLPFSLTKHKEIRNSIKLRI
jgi:hypothetical protein